MCYDVYNNGVPKVTDTHTVEKVFVAIYMFDKLYISCAGLITYIFDLICKCEKTFDDNLYLSIYHRKYCCCEWAIFVSCEAFMK